MQRGLNYILRESYPFPPIWKTKCKSKICVAFCGDISNCYLINPGAKTPSLFSLIIGSSALFLLVSFCFWNGHFPYIQLWLGSDHKGLQNVKKETKVHPVISRSLRWIMENNIGRWDASRSWCPQDDGWEMEKCRPHASLEDRQRAAGTALLSPALSMLGSLQTQGQLSRTQGGCGTAVTNGLQGCHF